MSPDMLSEGASTREHKKTLEQSKIFEVDLQKVKSILEEDIVNQIYKQCDNVLGQESTKTKLISKN